MKTLLIALSLLLNWQICSGEESSFEAYERLKKETGLTDEELGESIQRFAEFVHLMKDALNTGSFDPKELVATAKEAEKIIAEMQRQDELSAALTLACLRTLETKGSNKAGEFMAMQLEQFVAREFPTTEGYAKLRARIEEYSKNSPAFERRKQESEPADDANPIPPRVE